MLTTNLSSSRLAKQPVKTHHKASASSDTTMSGASEETAFSPADSQDYDKADLDEEYTVISSLLDQGMPRHYTRVCLGFRLGETTASEAIARLEAFFRRTFQAKPWLAGYACPVERDSLLADSLEIRFSQRHVEEFSIKVQELNADVFPLTYGEFCDMGMPPSKIPRHVVSACPDRRSDTAPAPILDVTANIVRGGLLIAIFFHHGVLDGASMGTIISGQICRGPSSPLPISPDSLAAAAQAEVSMRKPLSCFPLGQSLGVHAEYRSYVRATSQHPLPPLGRSPTLPQVTSRIFLFPDSALKTLKDRLDPLVRSRSNSGVPWLTTHDALQSLLWHHLTRARLPSVSSDTTDEATMEGESTLLIPVNIRKRLDPPLASTYLGGAAALVPAILPLSRLHLANKDCTQSVDEFESCYLDAAVQIHTAISSCTDTYVREVLALTAQQSSARNMVDLNADPAGGLDLVITSWSALPVFEDEDHSHANTAATQRPVINGYAKSGQHMFDTPNTTGMGMGLGPPDYIRKPWSRDAGGCIILPRDRRWKKGLPYRRDGCYQQSASADGGLDLFQPGLEVLIQLKTVDMDRLVQDDAFMRWVGRVVD